MLAAIIFYEVLGVLQSQANTDLAFYLNEWVEWFYDGLAIRADLIVHFLTMFSLFRSCFGFAALTMDCASFGRVMQ